MNKRPVAFRVPRLLGDMVSHYFVTTSEDEARAMADTNQVEYEGLYLVGDRHTFAVAQPAPRAITENDLYYLRSIQRQLQMVKESLDDSLGLTLGVMAFADNLDWLDCFIDEKERALAAQPPAATVETGDYIDPITTEEYFRGTLKVIAHWAEVDLSGEWETGLRGVIRSITDAAKETLSAHPEGKSHQRCSAETGEATTGPASSGASAPVPQPRE